MIASLTSCPICEGTLAPHGPSYDVQAILGLWKPIAFSEKVVAEHLSQSHRTQLYRCGRCRLGIFLPQVIGTPRFYVEAYNLEASSPSTELTYSASKWEFVEGVAALRSGDRVLEVGCGPGHFLGLAAAASGSVVGVEYNEPAADMARARGFEVHGSLDALGGMGRRFNWIFAFHVLEHVADPMEFLRRLKDVLEPQGRIMIAVPNQDGPIRFIEPCAQDMPPHHATRWSRRTFAYAAKRLRMRVERFSREPLSEQNAYYYTVYGARGLLSGRKGEHDLLQRLATCAFHLLTGGLLALSRFFGRRVSELLPGQAMYVILASED